MPKADETFYSLYDRARALESREKQYSAGSDKIPAGDQRKLVRKNKTVNPSQRPPSDNSQAYPCSGVAVISVEKQVILPGIALNTLKLLAGRAVTTML